MNDHDAIAPGMGARRAKAARGSGKCDAFVHVRLPERRDAADGKCLLFLEPRQRQVLQRRRMRGGRGGEEEGGDVGRGTEARRSLSLLSGSASHLPALQSQCHAATATQPHMPLSHPPVPFSSFHLPFFFL